ncbi:alpha/beta-hydrolase [Tothia fuscella]|uniref:Alpha/beta-hydrolase n=1 Tax=Tothia fuscella TaxID=1048955 RepID=A0A9P4NX18_9PEZI|nr:alpha/beta-hydrolase [Tothia fuscella]
MNSKRRFIGSCLAVLNVSVRAQPQNISFASVGETVVGDLYLPKGNGPFPAVVTGPGFAGVKEMLIPDYANALASAGIATLAFDYIGFGASSGKIRQDIQIKDQITSYRDALGVLEKDNRFDSKRLGAWGTSLGGAHTLVVSANDPRVKAAVAIIPHIELDAKGTEEQPSMIGAIEADVKAAGSGGKRVMVAVSGNPGDNAAMTTDGAVAWTKDVTKNAPLYRNEVTASSLLALSTYSTVADAANIKIPLRAITAKDDSITPASKIHRALDSVKGVDFKDFPGTHFGLFGANLTATIDLTVDWWTNFLSFVRVSLVQEEAKAEENES